MRVLLWTEGSGTDVPRPGKRTISLVRVAPSSFRCVERVESQIFCGNWAASEFQKFIDHPGLVSTFPWELARLGLARSSALQGDTARLAPGTKTSLPPGLEAGQIAVLAIAIIAFATACSVEKAEASGVRGKTSRAATWSKRLLFR
jgi:hypothetical protein